MRSELLGEKELPRRSHLLAAARPQLAARRGRCRQTAPPPSGPLDGAEEFLRLHNLCLWQVSLAVFAAIVCADLEAFGFESALLIGFAALGSAVVGLAAILYGVARRRSRVAVVGANLLLVPVLAIIASGAIAGLQRERSIARGEEIVAAIEAFRTSQGRLPESLDELVPGQLASIPVAAVGLVRTVPFSYQRSGDFRYQLSFAAPQWMYCTRSEKTAWLCED